MLCFLWETGNHMSTALCPYSRYLEKFVKLRHVTEILKTADSATTYSFHFKKKIGVVLALCAWQTAIFFVTAFSRELLNNFREIVLSYDS